MAQPISGRSDLAIPFPKRSSLVRPFESFTLEDLIGGIKGVSARHNNRALGTAGRVWEEESYDRIVRDEVHLWKIVQYIGCNSQLAGRIEERDWMRWIHPEWESVGWCFIDEK